MSGPIRIFVVDDQPLIRDGLSYILDHQDDMTVVGSAGTCPCGDRGLREHRARCGSARHSSV